MTESLDTDDTAPVLNPEQGGEAPVFEQDEEQAVPPEQTADCLQVDGLALCDDTSEQCYAVERRTIAQPTYSTPAVARLNLLAEVIGNPSGLLECQWKIADVVAESVNALEQRLLQIADRTDRDDSEDETDYTGACSPCSCTVIASELFFTHELLL